MTFSPEQKAALEAPLNRSHVKERSQSGRTLSYIEGWVCISEANRIFGFDAWSSETMDIRCVAERERTVGSQNRAGWGVSYVAKVRITVDGVTREGMGSGHGIDVDLGLAHESAIKESETDARKRALMTFGNPFGLALYDKTQANVVNDAQAAPAPSQPQQSGVKRLSSARAKEIGLDDKIKDQIAKCKTLDDLAAWDALFDRHTAEAPLSWLDSVRNNVILRGEEIVAETAGAGMDQAFRDTVGPEVH